MIVPDYWAEARRQHRTKGKQITVRRLGWSMQSEADAQVMAETRCGDALTRILAGDNLHRREHKIAYNGADGVPIREEVLARHGEEVITRNAYGAHCLNTPRALFADIDFAPAGSMRPTLITFALMIIVAMVVGGFLRSWAPMLGLAFAALFLAIPVSRFVLRKITAARGGPERIARRRIQSFIDQHPTWNLRLYKTPAGLRLLATHQPFASSSPEVQQFFAAVGTDPVYTRMCNHQRCFRARLTAKPWRVGIAAHMRPRPGVWPVNPARLPLREQWIAEYEKAASRVAACHFVDSLGSGVVHDDLRGVIDLHDRATRANDLQLGIA